MRLVTMTLSFNHEVGFYLAVD